MLVGMFAPHVSGAGGSGPSYRYWQIFITATNGSVYSTIQEAEFRGSVGGSDLTSPSTPTGASSSHASLPSSNLVDNNTSTAWGTNGAASATPASPHWVQVDLGSPTSVAEISITPPSAAFIDRAPKDFEIRGSDNNIDWTIVKTYTNVTTWTDLTPMAFSTT